MLPHMPSSVEPKFPEHLERMNEKLRRAGALKLVRKKLQPDRSEPQAEQLRYISLEFLIIEACADALAYQKQFNKNPGRYGSNDPFANRRAKDNQLRKQLQSHAACVRKLRSFISQNGDQVGRALAAMHFVEGVTIHAKPKMPLSELWCALLAALEGALQAKLLASKRGPFVHLTRVGPLDLGEPILGPGGSICPSETGLLFLLALYFRRYTSSPNVDADLLGRLETGEPMLDQGKPHWELCAHLLEAALDPPSVHTGDDIGRRMNKLLKAYPKLAFVGWPQRKINRTPAAGTRTRNIKIMGSG